MPNNRPTGQHFVQKNYLENFCDASGKLQAHHAQSRDGKTLECKWFESNPGGLATKQNIYTVYDQVCEEGTWVTHVEGTWVTLTKADGKLLLTLSQKEIAVGLESENCVGFPFCFVSFCSQWRVARYRGVNVQLT